MGLKESGGFNEEAFKKWWIWWLSKSGGSNKEAFKKWWILMRKLSRSGGDLWKKLPRSDGSNNVNNWIWLTKFPINAMKDSDVICFNNVYMHYTLFWGRGDSDVICFNNVFIYVTLFLEVGGYYQTCHFSYSVCLPSIFFWQKIWCRICTAEIKIISVRSVRLLQHF